MTEKEKRILELKIMQEEARHAKDYLAELESRLTSLISRFEEEFEDEK